MKRSLQLLALIVSASFCLQASAATITVNGSGDTIALDTFATLREAITSINNQADVNADVTGNRLGLYASEPGGTPDVIDFSVTGTILLASALPALPDLSDDVAISGPGANALTVKRDPSAAKFPNFHT